MLFADQNVTFPYLLDIVYFQRPTWTLIFSDKYYAVWLTTVELLRLRFIEQNLGVVISGRYLPLVLEVEVLKLR